MVGTRTGTGLASNGKDTHTRTRTLTRPFNSSYSCAKYSAVLLLIFCSKSFLAPQDVSRSCDCGNLSLLHVPFYFIIIIIILLYIFSMFRFVPFPFLSYFILSYLSLSYLSLSYLILVYLILSSLFLLIVLRHFFSCLLHGQSFYSFLFLLDPFILNILKITNIGGNSIGSIADNVRLKNQMILLKKELSDTTTAYEKLRVEHMKDTREIARFKSKLALFSDRDAVGDSLDIYLPVAPKLLGGDDRSGEREAVLRRRIALLETDLAAFQGGRRARTPSRSGTPPTPGGRERERERERERSRAKKLTRERSDSGYGSGGGYGSSRGTPASGSRRPGSSPFLQLSPATIAKARDRERERERSLSRGSSGYMRYCYTSALPMPVPVPISSLPCPAPLFYLIMPPGCHHGLL